MSALVLVDAGVLLCAQDSEHPVRRAQARQWIELLWREQRGRTSFHILGEYFFLATRRSRLMITVDDAWDDIQMFMTWAPLETNADLMTNARRLVESHSIDWDSALIVAAAQIQGCSLLLSEQLADGANFSGVVVRDPFSLGVAEERTAYEPRTPLVPLHRGRGRPRTRP